MIRKVRLGQSLSRYMGTGMRSTSFQNVMRMKMSAWLRGNAQALATVASVLSPIFIPLSQRTIEGPLGTLAGLGICFLVQVGVCVLRHYLAFVRERYTIPVPGKRFTEDRGDGEVTIEYARLQELILYMDELEDWLEENIIGREEDGSQ